MKLTIRQKLFGGFGLIIGLIIVLNTLTNLGTSTLKNRSDELKNLHIPNVVMLETINDRLKTIDQLTMRSILETDNSRMSGSRTEIEQAMTEMNDTIEKYVASLTSEPEKEAAAQFREASASYEQAVQQILKLSEANRDDEAVNVQRQTQELVTQMTDSLSSTINQKIATMNASAQDQRDATGMILMVSILALIVAVLLAAGLSLLISRSITRPLAALTKHVDHMAEGDLKQFEELQTLQTGLKGELGRLASSLERMGHNQRDILLEVGRTSGTLAVSAEEFKSVAQESASGAEHTVSTMRGMNESIEDQLSSSRSGGDLMQRMLDKIVVIRDRVGETSEAAASASAHSEQGVEVVGQAVFQMESTNEGMTEMTQAVEALNRRSIEIGGIVQLITNIAKQTNLLALNAAIEAARAGEHGKGFAVVASEVGKLAEQSSASAAQIIGMIDLVQEDAGRLSRVIEEATAQVSAGSEAIRATGELFGRIRETVGRVGHQSEQAVQASGEMVQVVEMVASAMMESGSKTERTAEEIRSVSVVSKQQAVAMRKMSEGASSLSEMADELEQLVGRFKL